MTGSKTVILILVTVIGVMGIMGCELVDDTQKDENDDPKQVKEEEKPDEKTKEAPEPLEVGVVFSASGLDDLSINDFAYKGMEEAAQDSSTVEWEFKEPEDQEAYASSIHTFAEAEKDLVIGVGATMAEAMFESAEAFPQVSFGFIDATEPADWENEGWGAVNENIPENMLVMDFATHEAAFLAGGLAAHKTETGVIGFAGGEALGWVDRLEGGYVQGAKYVDEETVIVPEHIENLDDPNLGNQTAESLINWGTDIIFSAAGNTSVGVFEAVKSYDIFGIASDSSQNWMAAGNLLTATVERVDTAVYKAIDKKKAGTFSGGELLMLDLESEGIALSCLEELNWWEESAIEAGYISEEELEEIEAMKAYLADEYKDVLEEVETAIIAGEIEVKDWQIHGRDEY